MLTPYHKLIYNDYLPEYIEMNPVRTEVLLNPEDQHVATD